MISSPVRCRCPYRAEEPRLRRDRGDPAAERPVRGSGRRDPLCGFRDEQADLDRAELGTGRRRHPCRHMISPGWGGRSSCDASPSASWKVSRKAATPMHMSRWVLAARGSRETWAAGPLRVVTGRRCWRQVCCPCAGRRRDPVPGWRMTAGLSSRGRPGSGERVAGGTVRGDDHRVLPVTPFSAWCFAPAYESGAGGRSCGLGTVAVGALVLFTVARATGLLGAPRYVYVSVCLRDRSGNEYSGQAPYGGELAPRGSSQRYLGPSLAGGEPPGTGGAPRAARRNWMRAAGMRSCSRASRASARASAAVGRFRSRARGHSRA